jgi:Domain of unknown function (DUF6438)
MKYIIIFTLIISCFSCKQHAEVANTTPKTIETQPTLVKESIFIKMERTPCLGKCPGYTITIFNTGNVVYVGRDFTEKIGKHTAKLTKEELEKLKFKIKAIDLFNLKDKYDQPITDIPSCQLYVQLDNQKKKILDRVGGPKELREFENLIDTIVITDRLIKVEK